MAVQFIVGRAGCGKTHHCFQTVQQWVREHGLYARVYLLLPQQTTFIAERQLMARQEGQALVGVRVVSFASLIGEIAPPALAAADVDGQGRRLLLAMAIQQCAGDLRYFRGAEQQPHLAERIDEALTEIEEAGTSVADMMQALGEQGEAIANKLADLGLIEQTYQRLLGENRLDAHRQYTLFIEAIGQSQALDDALVVVDGYADFTKLQRRLLVAIAQKARRMEIALMADPATIDQGPLSDDDLFFRTRRTLELLSRELAEAGVAVEPHRVLTQQHRLAARTLAEVEARFERPAPMSDAVDEAVQLVEASGELEEVQAAARQIRRWQAQGVRLRRIGVICRNLQDYAPWIAAVFAEHGIACFVDQKQSMSHHPLPRFVRCVLEIAMRGWQRSTVLEMLKTQLAGLSADEVDRLENFVLRHGIDGKGWLGRWDFNSAPAEEDEAADVQREREETVVCIALRDRALDPIRQIVAMEAGGEQAVHDMLEPLRRLLADPQGAIVRTIETWCQSADPQTLQEHRQCHANILKIVDRAEALLGDRRLHLHQLAGMLMSGMEGLVVKLTPPTLDQVLVVQIDRSRSPEFECAVVLGLNEGTFPATSVEGSLIGDDERRELQKQNIEMGPDSQRRAFDEQMLGYIALTRASREMVLMRPLADEDGRELSASGLLLRVEAIVKPLQRRRLKGGMVDAVTPAQVAGELAGLCRQRGQTHVVNEVQRWAASDAAPAAYRQAIASAMGALSYVNEPQLSSEVARGLLGDRMYCSPTRLEAFAACPFKHFVGRSLRLQEREIAEVSSLDLGNAFHEVLDQLGKRMIERSLNWSREGLREHLDELVEQVASSLRGEVLLSSARNRYLVTVIRRMLEKLVADQSVLERASRYRVHATEVGFGEEGSPYPALKIRTPAGRSVLLRGRIDRIDRYDDGKAGRYLVFDYKTGDRKLNLAEVHYGLSLQLMVYMLVLREQGRPVDGALYMRLMRLMKSVKGPKEREPDAVACKPRGILSAEALERMDSTCDHRSKLYGFELCKNDRQPGNEDKGDWAREEDLERLLEHVRRTIGELADRIFEGCIEIRPYQLGTSSPCSVCDYRSICRMDSTSNHYRVLRPMKRGVVFEQVNPNRPRAKEVGDA